MSTPRCTKYRHAVMALVLDAKIITIPAANGWQWREDVSNLLTLDGAVTTDTLAPAQSRALGELLDAKLIRISAAAPRSGRMKGVRRVFPTDTGRDWWTKGPGAKRGCSNKNDRGSAATRRRRRQWLLDTFGDGTKAACYLSVPGVCLGQVDLTTLSVERITPGHAGGTYRRGNIRPACSPCQSHQGGGLGPLRRQQREAGRRERQTTHS